MIIDCHTHIFPEKIAPKVLELNRKNLGLEPYGAGTAADLLAYMREAGISYSAAFAVSPEGRLVRTTNDWLISQSDPRLLLFGTVTPDFDDWEKEIDRIKAAGVIGIKFNPLFQAIIPDDRIMYPIYEKLTQEGMFVYYHSGMGSGGEERTQVRSTPKRLRRLHDDHPKLTLICAHLGGAGMLDEVREYLVGSDVYLDTSNTPTCKMFNIRDFMELTRAHGVERILYATDYPWAKQGKQYGWEYEWIRSLDLSEADKELILGGNAKRLFGL